MAPRRRRIMVAGLAAALILVAPGLSAAGTTATPARTLSAPSMPAGFVGESCGSSSSCIAVGNLAGGKPAAAHWNGTAWTATTVPTPKTSTDAELAAVSCPAANDCVAVGFSVRKRDPGVGLVESWNGSTWRVTARVKLDGGFEGVSCPTTTFCMAVGEGGPYSNVTNDARVAEWRNGRWTVTTPPLPAHGNGGFLDGVSCSSPSGCTAVGGDEGPDGSSPALIERWNGSDWSSEAPVPVKATIYGSYLSGVSCPSARTCTAVGVINPDNHASALIEAWNGTQWSRQTSATFNPNLGTGQPYVQLSGISCPTTTDCTAVGWTGYMDPGAVAENWNGETWTAETVAIPSESQYTILNAVSCPTTSTCAASGFWGARKGHTIPKYPFADGASDGVWSQQLPS